MGDQKTMECELPDVQGSSIIADVMRFVRYGVTGVGGYLVGKGYLEADTVEMIAAIATTATPIIVGTFIGRMNRKKLAKAVELAKSKTNSEG